MVSRVVVELHTSDRKDFTLSASIFYNNLGIYPAPNGGIGCE